MRNQSFHKLLIVAAFFIFSIQLAQAGYVDTARIYSPSMKKTISASVVVPDAYKNSNNPYPVVYLLHGYSGNYRDWVNLVPQLTSYVDQYKCIVVCPDGGYSSWYWDSPIDENFKYETHIVSEVVPFIDSAYRTIHNRKGRAITGLSMGGHGGLYLGWRHSNIFGACGSMSGGVDINSSRSKFDIAKRIGDSSTYPTRWEDYSVKGVVKKPSEFPLKIIVDCGTEDFFYDINKALHQQLLQLKVKHEYIERPGGHTWQYWANAVPYQLLFFQRFFNQQ
ncbi:MAG: esterase family protein [Hydrotalea sp.]|nr:esterase family protein [Hydrotalea sp.]